MNHGHTLLIDGTRRRAPAALSSSGARLLACWCTLLDLRTNAPPGEELQRTRELQVEKSNGITPIAAKKRRIPQPIARKTNPGDPPGRRNHHSWPMPAQQAHRCTHGPPHCPPPNAKRPTLRRRRTRRATSPPVMFLLRYLREFFEVADMPLSLLLPGPNLRYATMRMYTHNTTEGRRRSA